MSTQLFLHDSGQGEPIVPGAVWDCPAFHRRDDCPAGWTNCDGHHILVRFPTHYWFDICSRASNCGRPNDGEHRCWIIHGELPLITVDKAGVTCNAGQGSFNLRDHGNGAWHGMIRDGELVP